MKKALTVNIGGMIFHIDYDAYQVLNNYIEEIKKFLKNSSNREEIIIDIENRIAELLKESLSLEKEVINISDIEQVIETMGGPGEFKEEANDNNFNSTASKKNKRLFRNTDDRMIAGICSGLGNYFNIDATWVRIIFIVSIILSGASLLAYIILWIVVPPANTQSEKNEMYNNHVDFSNIEESVKKEMNEVKNKLEELAFQFRENFKKRK